MGVDYQLTEHALCEMRRRQIDPEWVEAIMAQPEQITPASDNRKVYQSRFQTAGKTYLVRLVVEDALDPPVIVTLYRTSKIEKYWSST